MSKSYIVTVIKEYEETYLVREEYVIFIPKEEGLVKLISSLPDKYSIVSVDSRENMMCLSEFMEEVKDEEGGK